MPAWARLSQTVTEIIMATALLGTPPVTIETFDGFIETKGGDARLCGLVEGGIVTQVRPCHPHQPCPP